MTTTAERSIDMVEVAKSLAPQIEAHRDQSERDRTMARPLVDAIAASGLFRMWTPTAFGGLELDLEPAMRVIEEISKADGAAGWNVMIAGTGGMFAAYLPEPTAREIYGSDPLAVSAGALAPKGHAVPVDGGYRLTGRWPLASGCLHASWLAGGALVFDGEAPRMGENGLPDIQLMFAPVDQCEIIDSWYSGGLRGTGSHDFAVADLFVPAERTFSFLNAPAHQTGVLYRAHILNLFSPSVAAVPLGIARAAIDEFVTLATGKLPTFSSTLLKDKPLVKDGVGRAEALLRSARAFYYETIGSVWATMVAGEPVSEEQGALIRLACARTAQSCAEAVDIVYTLGGATSVYATSRLDRCFRDVHTITQHMAVQPAWYERAGQYFLGMGIGGF